MASISVSNFGIVLFFAIYQMKMKDSRCTIIRFDYGGCYSKNGDDIRWNPKEDQIYTLVMKGAFEEFTYSMLVDRVCKKISVDESATMLKLSYVPLLEDRKRQTYILDDEDVLGYLMEGDSNQRRNVMHVEVVIEQVSGDDRRSGIANDAVLVNGENDLSDGVAYMDNYEMFVDDVQVDEEVVNVEWEDGIGLSLGQEFESKQEVQDLVEKAELLNSFEAAIIKSSPGLYVLKCRGGSGCKWYLRVAQGKNSDRLSVRTYNKMHTCSRITTSTRRCKRVATPQLVASVLQENFPEGFDTLRPKNLIDLVREKHGVKVSYATALRGKKQAARDLRANSHTPSD